MATWVLRGTAPAPRLKRLAPVLTMTLDDHNVANETLRPVPTEPRI